MTPVTVKISQTNLEVEGNWIPHMRNFHKRLSIDSKTSDKDSTNSSVNGFISDDPFQDLLNVATAKEYGFDISNDNNEETKNPNPMAGIF